MIEKTMQRKINDMLTVYRVPSPAYNDGTMATVVYLSSVRAILHQLRKGQCWCEMGIGNPMVKKHSEICLAVQEIMG